jgi:DNA repair protein RecO (recombination protein O)
VKKLIELQPAYLLHSRPFRDTSLIVDFLTRDYGRVSAVANGARRPKSSFRGLLQAFIPLQVSFSGKNDLKTFRHAELLADPFFLKANNLFGALYINEIIVRLIQGHESEAVIFYEYEKALSKLAKGEELEPVLRNFELGLLRYLGYEIEFTHAADSGEEVEADAWYYFQHESGFFKLKQKIESAGSGDFSGQDLLNIAQRNFSSKQTRTAAKHIIRKALGVHLGDKPLKSRQLFSLKS